MNYKKYNYDSYQIYTIQTNKFKNCYLSINFREDGRHVNLTRRNFLANLMSYTSKNYPTKRSMRIAEEELYNLSFESGLNRSGYNLFTTFSIDFLNPKYVKEKDYLEKNIAFLCDIIQNPNIKNETFDERSFSIVKEKTSVQINQYKEKPLSYAIVESKKTLFPDSLSGQRLVGTIEDLEEITGHTLWEEYHKMMENSYCDILIIGDLDMDEVATFLKKYFYKPSIVLDEIPFVIENKREKLRTIDVESIYSQTQLLVLYQMSKVTSYERDFIGPLFQRILGSSGMADKLTKYLREENSLCYYVACPFSFSDSMGMIYTGLKQENVSVALKYIRKSMKEMQDGIIDKDFLEIQKLKFLSDLRLREDNMYGLIHNYYFHEIMGKALFEEYQTEIPKITLKDLQLFAKKIQEAMIFCLKEESHEGN